MQPKEILMMDITPSEEELLSQMKSKTRYNIRLAEKKGVVVKQTREPEDIEVFLKIMQETALRKDVHFHPKEYFQAFLDFFSEDVCTLFVAVYEGKILAGSLVAFYEGTAYYLHGGSRDAGREVMAPHLLQWEQIREAKRRGCTKYDLGGVAIQTAPKGKDWSGITRFKRGFAPHIDPLVFPGTYDFVLHNLRYKLYSTLQKIRM
jgi:lipid II:glycine glycyltransferase (peptidoglycan interpeptide bridge formation enzyme)